MTLLLAQLELALPSRLLLLVLLPVVVWLALVGRKEKSLGQRLTSAALRSLVIVLLCFAWAAPSWRGTSERRFVVFVQDKSHSAASDGAARGQAFVEQALAARGSHRTQSIDFNASPNDAASDIAAAITLAQASCPNDYVPQIVLQTDGLETTGNALAAAVATPIPISIVPLEPLAQSEVAVDTFVAPAHAAAQESFEVVATLASNRATPATVKLFRDEEPIAEQRVDLSDGTTTWRHALALGDRPQAMLKVTVEASADATAANNSLSAVVLARAPAKVLVVDNQLDAAQPLVTTLSKLGYRPELMRPSQLPTADIALRRVSLIVLREVTASNLGAKSQAALDRYVRAGGGLLVVGGETSFGAATYQLTGLERMLPVVATEQPEEQQRSLALVLVVDKSLSMKDENRFELAKAAAKRVVDVLGDNDQVGVVAFGDDSQWVSRLAPLADKNDVLGQIDKLEASGLTNMYPAIARAYLALSQADADRRYAIILTDGVPSPGDFGDIARKMADAGITVSTVSLSAGADQTILKDIARIARGNHHHAADPADLPQILEGETRTAVSSVAPSETTALVQRKFPGLDVASAPPVTGFVTTKFKPGAQVLLVAGEGDPLVAWWRYGRGVAMVITADVVSGDRWRTWPGSEAFWRTLTKHALRDEQSHDAMQVREVDGRVTVDFDLVSAGERGLVFVNDAQPELTARRLNDELIESLPMMQIAPGRYSATFTKPLAEPVILQAGAMLGEPLGVIIEKRGFAPRYADEFRLRAADDAKLKNIAAATGGVLNPEPTAVFAPDGRTVDVLQPLFAYFLIAALAVYLCDVAVRRIPATRADVTTEKLRRAA